MPSFAPYIHPSYLASFGDKLTILVSHGHDDHCDDKLLTIFDKDTHFVTANFKSPSVLNRLKKLGFKNITTVGEEGNVIDEVFNVKSFIVKGQNHDDAKYTIKTKDGVVIHANDNWFDFTNKHLEIIKSECDPSLTSKAFFCLVRQILPAASH